VLQVKDLRKRSVGEKVIAWDEKILVELEGPLGGRALFAGHEGSCLIHGIIITYWYSMSRVILTGLDIEG
jgi:hypothetical protein